MRKCKRCKKRNRELRLLIKLLRILIKKCCSPQITVNANPSAQAATDNGTNVAVDDIFAAGRDIKQSSKNFDEIKSVDKSGAKPLR
ncbi:hypothetical protein SAMN05444955_10622 [Lihuaxuella thermophila]|uniref:Uncharacterized protein n=2 Tax=Lihuaxuella thermophila TaxID=1173111 RepID=A0A1H8DZ66_9BACL|nr:hypothetical protein SAMN05444955_10622 [Lihuaxuella thermophila]